MLSGGNRLNWPPVAPGAMFAAGCGAVFAGAAPAPDAIGYGAIGWV
jgi:hypothetical protein